MSQVFKPRPYQTYAIEKIIHTPAVCLMLDMGMGKTVATLTAIQELMFDRFEIKKVLVIAPLRVAETTWLDENAIWEHLHLRVIPVLGSLKKRVAALNADADVYVINRDNVCWLVDYYRKDFPFDMLVIDESSSFKNPSAKRFKALRKIRPLVKKVVELTGTPAPNSLMDLWSQIYLLDKGERLGHTLGEYRRHYFTEGASNGHIVYNWNLKKGADKVIYRRISDICISMKANDYLSLPPAINNYIKVPLDSKVAADYQRFEKELVLNLGDGDLTATSAAVLANKLLQFANGAVYDSDGVVRNIHSAKLDALEEICETVNQPILVFYWFKHDLARLMKRFPQAVR